MERERRCCARRLWGTGLGSCVIVLSIRQAATGSSRTSMQEIGNALMQRFALPLEVVGAAVDGCVDWRGDDCDVRKEGDAMTPLANCLLLSAFLFSHWSSRCADAPQCDSCADRNRADAQRGEPEFHCVLALWPEPRSSDRIDVRHFFDRRCGGRSSGRSGFDHLSIYRKTKTTNIDQSKFHERVSRALFC